MTSVKLTPARLHGTVAVPSSKSMGHRLCICAGLSREGCIVDNIALSKDIEATNRCLAALDVSIRPAEPATEGRHAFAYSPSGMLDGSSGAAARTVDCGESGSTLRFFIPLAALTNVPITFTGHGKLVSRPEQPYYDLFDRQSLPYRTGTDGHLPLTVHGRLRPGAYELPGDVSSQFVSGLLFALPLLDGDSDLTIVPPLESASYIGLTVQSVRRFGITIDRRDDLHYHIPGRQAYHAPAARVAVEGDWSQAAFWLVAGSVGGAPEGIACAGLEGNSRQGDKAVLDILRRMGADITVSRRHVLGPSGLSARHRHRRLGLSGPGTGPVRGSSPCRRGDTHCPCRTPASQGMRPPGCHGVGIEQIGCRCSGRTGRTADPRLSRRACRRCGYLFLE
jgi:3-phosphoshikimate 1-carboxyvinyltransferase